MIDLGKKNILGVYVNAIDYQAAITNIVEAAHSGQPFSVSALAVHGVMTGVHDPIHRYRLNHLNMVLPDGQPVRWALNCLHRAGLPDRVYGPTLMWRLCERAAQEGLSVFLFGSSPLVLQDLSTNLLVNFPNLRIAGTQASLFRKTTIQEKQEIVSGIQQSGASLVFVGLGCPRQEVWIYEYQDNLSMPLIAVGAAFDFHAGHLPQAPQSLQKIGLEWLFRLLQEPKRLWRRYLFNNPEYLFLLLLQWTGFTKFDPSSAIPPREELRYG